MKTLSNKKPVRSKKDQKIAQVIERNNWESHSKKLKDNFPILEVKNFILEEGKETELLKNIDYSL